MKAFSSVRGLKVALVGNSSDGLLRTWGEEIDAHDVVIRMNAGAPAEEHWGALGKRTSILAIGTIQALDESLKHLEGVPELWWWKATKMGRRQHAELQSRGLHPFSLPERWFLETKSRVGAPPSGGIELILALAEKMGPESVSVFNVDFFGELGSGESWWHTERPKARVMRTHPHDGKKELALFKSLGFKEREAGWWTVAG